MKRLSKYLLKYFAFVAVIAIIIWALSGADVSVVNIVKGVPNIFEYLGRMIPPSGDIVSRLGGPLAETLQIAIVATLFSTIVALPLSFLAAGNVMSNRLIYQVSRSVLGILRGIPPLLYAILFVSMVGLGPFAGVLALTLHCIGALGRFYSEAIENINPEIINAAKATGGNKIQVIVHAIIPELAAVIMGYMLYYFEYNIRTSTILGLVGAGGIGLQLMINLHLFKYAEVATIMLVIIGIIIILDRFSIFVRTRLIRG